MLKHDGGASSVGTPICSRAAIDRKHTRQRQHQEALGRRQRLKLSYYRRDFTSSSMLHFGGERTNRSHAPTASTWQSSSINSGPVARRDCRSS